MRVLVVWREFFTEGGIQQIGRMLLKALAEQKEVQLTAFSMHDQESKNGVVGFSGNKVKLAWSVLKNLPNTDMLILGHINLAPFSLASRCLRKRSILWVYGLEVWRPLPFLARTGAQCATKIVSISGFTQNIMCQHTPLSKNKFYLIPPCPNPDYENPVELSPSVGAFPRPLLLTVSRLAPPERQKGIEHVLQTLPFVLKEFPKLTYLIVGDGEDRERLEELTKMLGVKNNVRFVGEVPNKGLASYYTPCDIFVLPSAKEGFGIVFLEAMFHKKPVIAARADATQEIVEDGVTGILVEWGSVAEIANALLTLLKNPALRTRMGEAGYKKAQEKFLFKHFVKSAKDLIHMH